MSVTSRTKGKYAFLASTWASPDMKRLRKDIHALGGEGARSVWVAEIDAPELKPENEYGPLAIVDRCLDEIENAEIFFLVVDGEFGSSIELDGLEAPSSYIELELFQAVMHEKPIHVIVIGDIAENSPVARLIDMISFGVGEEIERVSAHTNALDTAARILQSYRWRFPFLGRRKKRILSGRLALQRHHDFANRILFSEIQFLKGEPYFVGRSVADLDLAEDFLRSAREEAHSNRRMSRTWLAIRCLMHHHYLSSSDQRALKLWEDALRSWSKFAGWRGLHAHLWLGHVAALGSLVSVLDRRGRSLTRIDGIEHADNLGGAFASVYYSLSKIAPRNLAESFMSRSTLYVEHGLNSVERQFQSGLYAIRGSINLRRRDAKLAIEDYRRALDLAEAHGHGEQRIGELLAELGWAELWRGQFFAGRSHIEQGVSTMDDAGAGPGFRVRGKRKLVVAKVGTFALRGAYQSALSARDLIQEYGLFDQMDIMIRTADRVQRLIDSIKLTR